MNPKVTAALLILAAVLANVGLHRARLDLQLPGRARRAGGRRARRRSATHEGAVSAWFTVLALSAALLAPIAIGVGRLSSDAARCGSRCGSGSPRRSCRSIGLLRWPILVPGYAADGDTSTRSGRRATSSAPRSARRSATLLTAAWTALVIVALGRALRRALVHRARRRRPRRSSSSACSRRSTSRSSTTANFIGYVLWSVWLIAFGVVMLVRAARRARGGGDVVTRAGSRSACCARACSRSSSTTRSSTSRCRRWCASSTPT